jgi:hypothetical protein
MQVTREYPGTPGRDTAIQSEIAKVTGGIPQPIACNCRRVPMIVSVRTDIVCVACPCGMRGPHARTTQRAVRYWDRYITEQMLGIAR